MTHQDETKPKAPQGLKEALSQSPASEPEVNSLPEPNLPVPVYYDTQAPTPPRGQPPVAPPTTEAPRFGCLNLLTLISVLGVASCLCLSLISLSGLAGVRDEWRAISTEGAETRVAEAATQYVMGNRDLAEGNYELARVRFEAVMTQLPNYQDAGAKLAEVELILSYTPTPTLTPSPLPPTSTVTPTLEVENTAAPTVEAGTPNPLEPAALFGQAETAINQGTYEEAIEWLDALVLVDGNYRRDEVQKMRVDALVAQGRIYLRGQNEDGEDRLAQGVQLIFRADELGEVSGELVYEADFVARYLAARAYVEGAAYDQARPVLTKLCEEDCDWNYRGVSVRDLLGRAGG